MKTEMESQADPPNQPSDFEWLGKYYIAANGIKGIFDDDFATVKRRLLDKNRSVLENSPDSNWFAKYVVKNFVQSVSKSMENLTELKLEVINELRSRYPGLKEEWLLQGGQRPPKSPSCTGRIINGYLSHSQPVEHLRNGTLTDGTCSSLSSCSESSNKGQIDQKTVIKQHPNVKSVQICCCKEHDNCNVSNNKNNHVDEGSLDQESNVDNNDSQNEQKQSNIIRIEDELKMNTEIVLTTSENSISPMDDSKSANENDLADEIPEATTSIPETVPDPPEEALNDTLVITPEKEKEPAVVSSRENAVVEPQKSQVVIDDEVPGPSRLIHLSKRRLAKATKRVFEKRPLVDSSDSDFDEPRMITKKREPVKETTNKPKIPPKGKSALRSKRGRNKNSRKKLPKIDEDEEELELDEDVEITETTENYWKHHDYKKDPKLKMEPHVVLNRISIKN